jgi:hypothetical protein
LFFHAEKVGKIWKTAPTAPVLCREQGSGGLQSRPQAPGGSLRNVVLAVPIGAERMAERESFFLFF